MSCESLLGGLLWSPSRSYQAMAPANRRTCQVAGCSSGEGGLAYTTMEGLHTQDSVIEDLKLHVAMAHPNGMATISTKTDKNEPKPDRFPRPEISEQASDTDWQFFLASWETYKRATHLSGQNACDQLWYCPSESLKKKIFDAGIRPTNNESEILEGIKKLCVKAHNNMVNVMNFQNIFQRKSESLNEYAARLNGAANICDFLVTCPCGKEANFGEKY